MTIDKVDLMALIEKGADADFLREMIEVISNRLMEMEVENLTGAGHGERSPTRTNHSNGYRECQWETRAGTVDLAIPKLRKGSYFPAAIRTAFTQETEKAAHAEWKAVAGRLRGRFPKLADLMEEAEHDVLAHMAFPKEHWPQLHSTNPLERLNGEIKRPTDVAAIFPNEAAIVRLIGAMHLEQNDEWAASRARYMSLEKLASLSDEPQSRPKRIAAV